MRSLIYTSFRLILLSILVIVIFFACKKGMNNDQTPPITSTPPDLTTTVSSSFSGFVTDENEAAVLNATVKVGSMTTTTDKYGFFQALNVQVVQNAAVVTIVKPGYFNSIKTFIAEAGKPVVMRIKMIPKTISGTISGSAGGIITLPNNLSISYPANALVNAASGAPYTGTATVSAYWIDPTSADVGRIMPGDLRGLNTGGNLQLLTTYGMAAVEMNGSGGELLQIATGKKATLSMPIPPSISGSAPATIPLWFFDAAKGLWKQEGIATKTGNNYVGDVSHFSFWNCDVPNNYVQFNCTILSINGQPLPNVPVKISVVGNPANAGYGITNAAGYVNGAVPDNQQLLLEVIGNCNTPVFSQNFTTTNVNVSFGSVTIPAAVVATVSGRVLDCANAPVTNGYIVIRREGGQSIRFILSSSGTYSVNLLLCPGNSSITLVGEDVTALKRSIPANFSIMSGNNAMADIQACSVSFAMANTVGYFYHPSSPRAIFQDKDVVEISSNVFRVEVGDLPAPFALLTLNPVTNLITIADASPPVGGPLVQFNTGLPTTNPGYTPAWSGSSLCNNTYDPIQRKFKLRYGYTNGTGYRVIEEIITRL